ncbi:MAG: MBL fold metallo-hydrolase, partial [Pseudomonadota bacterium]
MSDYPVDMQVKPDVRAFFDPATNTISYIAKDPGSRACAIIDSVMDIDYAAGRITHDHADAMIAEIEREDMELQWIIETHVHADHLSAAPYIQQKLGGRIGIGSQIMVIQETFGKIFNEGTEFQRDGSQFDALFEDGDTYEVGQMAVFVMATPGHTPACMVHVMGNAAFAGDTLFMPDGGSARADFP